IIGNVLKDLRGDDAIESAIGERQRQRVALHGGGWMIGRQLSRLHHSGERAAHLGHFLGPRIECHHLGTTSSRLEGVASETAPEIEQVISRLHAELVVVNRQHTASLFGSSVSIGNGAMSGAPGSGLPSNTAS